MQRDQFPYIGSIVHSKGEREEYMIHRTRAGRLKWQMLQEFYVIDNYPLN